MIQEAELIKCLQLINSENVGPVTFYKLLVRYRSLDNALEALPSLPKYRLFSKAQAQREYELARSKNIHIISIFDEEYPHDLKQINDAPPILYVRGRLDLLKAPAALAIVGARNASINGRKTASHIAYDLTNSGVLIISGMARGSDLYFAEAVLELRRRRSDVALECARPCESQADRWPEEERARYQAILDQCDYETLVQHHYDRFCMMRRNRYMVDRSARIIAVGSRPVCVKLAREFGATEVISYRDGDVVQQVLARTGGVGADSVILCGGGDEVFTQAVDMVRYGTGTISNVNYYGGTGNLGFPKFSGGRGMAGKTIHTELARGGRARIERLLAMVQYGRIDPGKLVTHRLYGLDEVETALYMMREKADDLIKVMVKIDWKD